MRIISGKARGVRLTAPVSDVVRPTEDRVKEALFSILGDLTGAVVLDLFSGTGSLGLEAVSRGAAKVYLVERDQRQIDALGANLAAVAKAMPEASAAARIIHADVGQLAGLLPPDCRGAVNLILADPPYHTPAGDFGAAALLQCRELVPFLSPDCRLALEQATGDGLPWAPFSPWHLRRQKLFGIRTLSFAALA